MTQLTLFSKEKVDVNSVEILRGGDFMKNIVFILLSFCLAGEMEVDGDLKVTGNIQSQTIDSLLQVIQDLQNQIALLQSSVGFGL